MVQSLFRRTTETGSHINAKGENGFFLTIKNSNDPRVQIAWQMPCSGDSSKINEALRPEAEAAGAKGDGATSDFSA